MDIKSHQTSPYRVAVTKQQEALMKQQHAAREAQFNSSLDQLNNLLFKIISNRYENAPDWADKKHLIGISAQYQVGHLKAVYKAIMGENWNSALTSSDIFEAKQKFPAEIEIISTYYQMRNQGRGDDQIKDYLNGLDKPGM